MAVPKKKRSLQKRRVRRSAQINNRLVISTNQCSKCNALKRIHYACPECGHYK